MEDAAHPLLRSYGRIKSRPIKPRQAALVEELLPSLRPPEGPFDPRALMAGAQDAWLEIGFGGGYDLYGVLDSRGLCDWIHASV